MSSFGLLKDRGAAPALQEQQWVVIEAPRAARATAPSTLGVVVAIHDLRNRLRAGFSPELAIQDADAGTYGGGDAAYADDVAEHVLGPQI